MKPAFRGGAAALVIALAAAGLVRPTSAGRAAEPPAPTLQATTLPAGTALAAVIRANDGRLPRTGEQLWAALGKVGKFAQLPVPFSAVRLTSGLTAPRVVIAPHSAALRKAGAAEPTFDGRLFLAANMEQPADGDDPRVTTVEFISWNPVRLQFDFGLIEDMGGMGEPRLSVADANRCFTCHRNRGPILGERPWSNTTHDDVLRAATATRLQVNGTKLHRSGPLALGQLRTGAIAPRDRIDGMALAAPEAAEVDAAVRLGDALLLTRNTFSLMTRTPDGRKALAVLLAAVAAPGPLAPADAKVRTAVNTAFGPSFLEYAADLVELQKAGKSSTLFDVPPGILLEGSGARPSVVGGWGGGGRIAQAIPSDPAAAVKALRQMDEEKATDTLATVVRYDNARAAGKHGLIKQFQPSNPKAFAPLPVFRPQQASEVLTPALLATVVGLTDGDRRFLAATLAGAVGRVNRPKVTAAVLARGVVEGSHFAGVLAGDRLPDRGEFKDRFVDGLGDLLEAQYGLAGGPAPDRRSFATGPRYNSAAAAEPEAAVVPTTACLRCHTIAAAGKAGRFDPIPPLAFDPFDPRGREAWLRAADPKRKRDVLARMTRRVADDEDMPPEETPEYGRLRVREAAAFNGVKQFLEAELARAAGR
ncbi:MAG TPA: hypothetical protein VH092_07670 [Urbifossiella sp.]|nr:hypothetical protein [Urbifossiella sp.]